MMNMFNIQPQQYLPSAPSGNTVQVMNTIAGANNVAAQFGSLSDIMGQAMTADLQEQFVKINNEGKGIKISLKDIKRDARYLSKMTPAMAVAAGLTITDDYGNTIIGPSASQKPQQQQMFAPQQQQQQFTQQQFAPQQPQQLSSQQQFAMMMMQELKQLQAQMNQSAPAPSNNSFSQGSTATDAWDLASSDPLEYWDASTDSTDEGTTDFWGNSTTSTSSKASSSNPFFDVGTSSTPANRNTSTANSNGSSQTEQQQFMDKMMQMMMMMMQGGMMAPQNSMQMSQQQYMQYPQQKSPAEMTLMEYKAQYASTNMVANLPQQTAPKQSALTQRVMENLQNSSSDSTSF